MRCPRCGAEASPESTYCDKCGSRLYMRPSENAISPRIRQEEKRKPVRWLIISVIGLVMVLGGVLVWTYEVHKATHDITDINTSESPFRLFGNFVSSILWAFFAVVLIVFGSIFILAGLVLALAAAFD